jgi:hypothetical protein
MSDLSMVDLIRRAQAYYDNATVPPAVFAAIAESRQTRRRQRDLPSVAEAEAAAAAQPVEPVQPANGERRRRAVQERAAAQPRQATPEQPLPASEPQVRTWPPNPEEETT